MKSSEIPPGCTNLLDALRSNNSQCIEFFRRKCFGSIQAFILKNSGNETDAEDVYQDAIMILYEKSKTDFQLEEGGQPCAYLLKVAINKWIRVAKKRAQAGKNKQKWVVTIQRLETLYDEALDRAVREEELRKLLERKFEMLGERTKKALRLFSEGISMKEIAEVMGYENGDVAKKEVWRFRKQLKKMIQSDPDYKDL